MGLLPARIRTTDLANALRSGRRLASAGQRHTRAALVIGEVALATMLLVSAGLVARSLVRLLGVHAGFDPSHLLTIEINSRGPRYTTSESLIRFHERVLDAVRAIPDVELAATANQLPLGGNMDRFGVLDPMNMPSNPELAPSGDRYVVSTDYLRTMRIPLLRGRAFTDADARDSVNCVALISAELADRLYHGVDPIGRFMRVGGPGAPARRIIGIVGNVRHTGLDATVTMQWYVPERQWPNPDNQEVLIVRTHGDPAMAAQAVRRAVASVDPTQAIAHLATMDRVIADSTAQRRLALVLFAAFAVAALMLAVAGIYGVLAGSVAERTRELGIRTALGATPGEILALVLREGGRLGAVGIGLGIAGSFAVTRFLRALLFGVGPADPGTFVGVVVLLGLVTVIACLVPGRRASRVDPSLALRGE
jgi:putative ABC transport system permease protein